MKRNIKLAAGMAILVATVAAFITYARAHPTTIQQIRHINPATLLVLLAVYGVVFFAVVLVLQNSMRIYHKKLSYREGILLNAYSSLINFFGPGQSGIAVRGAYLNKKHALKLKQYFFATLLYYGCYATCSAFLLFVGSRPWWQTVLLVLFVATCSTVVIRQHMHKSTQASINIRGIIWLSGATVLQMAAQTIIYFVELLSVSSHITLAQALTYTGAANFALFVSLTPAAIGIREFFLIFTQKLHHISSNTIVSANVIDRAVYLLFLGLLFVIVLIFHARQQFRVTNGNTNDRQ